VLRTVWASVGLLALAATGTVVAGYAFAPPVGIFSYPAPDGRGSISYNCELQASHEESEANARAAYSFYIAAASDLAKRHAAKLFGNMKSYDQAASLEQRTASLNEVSDLRATTVTDRKSLSKAIRQLFSCSYLKG